MYIFLLVSAWALYHSPGMIIAIVSVCCKARQHISGVCLLQLQQTVSLVLREQRERLSGAERPPHRALHRKWDDQELDKDQFKHWWEGHQKRGAFSMKERSLEDYFWAWMPEADHISLLCPPIPSACRAQKTSRLASPGQASDGSDRAFWATCWVLSLATSISISHTLRCTCTRPHTRAHL